MARCYPPVILTLGWLRQEIANSRLAKLMVKRHDTVHSSYLKQPSVLSCFLPQGHQTLLSWLLFHPLVSGVWLSLPWRLKPPDYSFYREFSAKKSTKVGQADAKGKSSKKLGLSEHLSFLLYLPSDCVATAKISEGCLLGWGWVSLHLVGTSSWFLCGKRLEQIPKGIGPERRRHSIHTPENRTPLAVGENSFSILKPFLGGGGTQRKLVYCCHLYSPDASKPFK